MEKSIIFPYSSKVCAQHVNYTVPRALLENFRAYPSHTTGAHNSLNPAGRAPLGQGETKGFCPATHLLCLGQTLLNMSVFFLDHVSKWGTRKIWQLDQSGCSLCIALTSPVWCSQRAELRLVSAAAPSLESTHRGEEGEEHGHCRSLRSWLTPWGQEPLPS